MNKFRRVLFAIFSILADPDDSFGVTDTWDGNGGTGANNNFSNNLNWLDDTAPASDLVNTDLIFATTNKLTPNVSAAFSANSITFNNTSGAFTIGGQKLSLGAGGIRNDDAETMTFTNDVDFSGVASASIQAASGGLTFTGGVTLPFFGVLTVTGPNNTSFGSIGGSGSLTKNGLGVMSWAGGSVFIDVTLNNGAISTAADGLADTFTNQALQINNAGIFEANESVTLNNSQWSLNGATSRLTVIPGKTLFIQNGGDLSLTNATAEFDVSGLLMTGGSGSTITAINLGLSNNGTFSIQDDSVVSVSGSLLIGSFGNGTVTINDASLSAGTTTIGQSGFDGTLTLNNGALGTLGAVELTNGGSVNSDGRLNIQSAAQVHATGLIVAGDGGSATSTGIVTITGSSSFLELDGAATATIGSATGSVGTLNVQSSGSFLSGTGLTTVNATGTIAITGGVYTSHGNLTLNGGQLTRDTTGVFGIDSGKIFTIQAGGDATFTGSFTNTTASSIVVTGTGSTLATSASSFLSVGGGSSLSVQAGGDVILGSALLVGNNGNGSLAVDGAGSSIVGDQGFAPGAAGFSGTATFTNGSLGNFAGTIVLANSTTGTTNCSLTIGSGASVLGATLNAGSAVGNNTTNISVSGAGSNLGIGGNSIIGATSTAISTVTINNGSTFTTGVGTVTLNTTGVLNILAGGTLTGPSDFAGTGVLNLAGNYKPGAEVGANQTTSVTFAQNIALQSTTAITMEIGGTNSTEFDQLVFNGAGNPHITWNGALTLTLINGFVPQVENAFNLFDFDSARDSGAFTSVNAPALGAGKFWRFDQLYNSGVVRISVTADTYNQWQTGYATGAFSADDDLDGIPNGVEFLLGTNPKAATAAPLTELKPVVGADLTTGVSFKIPSDPASNARYRVEGSFDLVSWTQIAVKDGSGAWTGSAAVTTGGTVSGLTQITVTETLDPSFKKRFHRLRALAP